jgi:hypothetical protein
VDAIPFALRLDVASRQRFLSAGRALLPIQRFLDTPPKRKVRARFRLARGRYTAMSRPSIGARPGRCCTERIRLRAAANNL